MKIWKISITAIALMLMGGTANAAVVTYTDEATFLGAVSDPTLESFESLPTSTQAERHQDPITTDDFTATIAPLDDGIYAWRVTDESRTTAGLDPTDGSQYIEIGAGLSSGGAAISVTFSFDNPIDSFGLNVFDFGDLGGAGELSLSIDLGDEFLIASSTSGYLGNGNILFFGLTSDVAFSQVVLSKTSTTDGIGIDEVYYTTVPEPGTLVLFAVGLLGLAFVARRRRAVKIKL